MTGVWEFAFVFFLVALTILVFLCIPALLEFRTTLRRFNKSLQIVNQDLPEILQNVRQITDTVNNASKKLDTSVKNVVELEQMISNEIKQPLQNIAQTIAMLLQVFNKIFRRKASK